MARNKKIKEKRLKLFDKDVLIHSIPRNEGLDFYPGLATLVIADQV